MTNPKTLSTSLSTDLIVGFPHTMWMKKSSNDALSAGYTHNPQP